MQINDITEVEEEIESIVKMFKLNNAPRERSVAAEMLKGYGDGAKRIVYRMVNKLCEEEMVPNKWRIALISPVNKNGLHVRL